MNSLKYIFLVLFVFKITHTFASSNSQVINYTVSGYDLSVYLPTNYSKSKTYKVIYVNDGQWLFRKFQSLQLDKKLDSLIDIKAIEPIIVVGVHSNQFRTETYVPYKIEGNPYFQSKTPEYATTLTQKIIPFIDKKFSTQKNRNARAIFGFSFGGLNATWVAIHYPDSFSFCAGFSPSYWVDNHQAIKDLRQLKKTTTFWLDIGTNEWNYYVPFIELAKQQGEVYGTSIFYYEVPNGEHTIKDWKKRITYPIILFASTHEGVIKDWDIEIEVIKSQSRAGVFYQRINPIVTLNNGVKYSLADQATYTLKNKNNGELKADGRFKFNSENDLEVTVSYKGLKKEVKIKYLDIQKLKK